MSIGKRIKHSRKVKNLTQTQLAKQVNVSSQVISNWEREYTSPNNDDIARLSKALEVSADYLIGNAIKPGDAIRETRGNYGRIEQDFLEFLQDPELSLWFKEISESPEDQVEELRDFWEFIKNRKKKN